MMVDELVRERPHAVCEGPLRKLCGKRIALVIAGEQFQSVMCGLARYIRLPHDFLLRITMEKGEELGDPVVEIWENSWTGTVVPDHSYGCDYQLRLDLVPGT